MRLHIKCPNCGKPAYSFRLRQLSTLVTEVAYDCRNPACGASFVFTGEVSRYLRMPSFVNPQVHVPLSPIVQRRQIEEAMKRLHTATLPPEGEIVSENEGEQQLDIFHHAPADELEGEAHGP